MDTGGDERKERGGKERGMGKGKGRERVIPVLIFPHFEPLNTHMIRYDFLAVPQHRFRTLGILSRSSDDFQCSSRPDELRELPVSTSTSTTLLKTEFFSIY